jgi:N-hydroxyarylamine O-acetyltransferase
MLASPNAPPNHGTVVVACEGKRHIVDASILHGEPLPLEQEPQTAAHGSAVPAYPWSAWCDIRDGKWTIHWRPLHKRDGLDCRLEELAVSAQLFHEQYELSRPWSPFNYQLYGRLNRDGAVFGVAFGKRIECDANGKVVERAVSAHDRIRFLVEELQIHEELALSLPPDVPTPPPPQTPTTR